MKLNVKFLTSILVVLLLLFFSFLVFTKQNRNNAKSYSDVGKENLLQFSSSGNVLGFNSKGYVVASSIGALRVEFVNANNATPQASGVGQKTSSPVPELSSVKYDNLWEGVNAIYKKNDNSVLKSEYVVSTGENKSYVENIRLKYNKPVEIDDKGNLIIKYKSATLTEKSPVAWQETSNGKNFIDVSFKLHEENIVGFALGEFIPGVPVVIDPDLVWNTFLYDILYGIAVDDDNFIYTVGYSAVSWGSPVRAYTASQDATVVKYNSSGEVIWNTYLGGTLGDTGYGMSIGANSKIYVAGSSNATWGSPVRAYTSNMETFVAALDLNGALLWHTFLGAAGNDWGMSATADVSGNVYITGTTSATWGTPIRAYSSGYDAFVAKLDGDGNLLWNTFLGTTGDDLGSYAIIDQNRNIIITGNSLATWGSPINAFTADNDGFLAKVDNDGSLVWNTFFGTTGNENAIIIVADTSDNIYLAGNGSGSWGSPINAYSAGIDIFIAKYDTNGALVWNTFMGGSGNDIPFGINLGSDGSIYLGGHSNATWGSPVNSYTTGFDALLFKLDSNGNFVWSTFAGASGTDYVRGLALDSNNYVYLGGYSNATWGSPINAYTSGSDGFVAKIEGFPSISSTSSTDADFETARIIWNTDVSSSSLVEYGTTTSYGHTTTENDAGSRILSHSMKLTSLSPCTTYHYRVKSKDGGLTENIGQDKTFQTFCINAPQACSKENPKSAPKLVDAARISGSSVLLNFTKADGPLNGYSLQYGTKTGSYQFGVENMPVNLGDNMTFRVNALAPNSNYYFRLRAINGCASGPWSNEASSQTSTVSPPEATNSPTSTPVPDQENPSEIKTPLPNVKSLVSGNIKYNIAGMVVGIFILLFLIHKSRKSHNK